MSKFSHTHTLKIFPWLSLQRPLAELFMAYTRRLPFRRTSRFRRFPASRRLPFRRMRSAYRRPLRRSGFVAQRRPPTTGPTVPVFASPGVEMRTCDQALNYTLHPPANDGVGSVATAFLLNQINRGLSINEREGNVVQMQNLILRLSLCLIPDEYNGGAAHSISAAPVTIRLLLVYAREQTTTENAIGLANVFPPSAFLDTTTVPADALAACALPSLDARQNFQILYDNKFIMKNDNDLANIGPTYPGISTGRYCFRDFDLVIPISRGCTYDTSLAFQGIGDSRPIKSGSLVLYILADSLRPFGGSYTQRINLQVDGAARLTFTG